MPELASINDWIRGNRLGVVHALSKEDAEYDRLEREAIQNEADFDNAKLPGDDGGTIGDR